MSMQEFTPAKRVTLALATLVYIFASHGALAGGLLLQAVWLLLGLSLIRLLVVSLLPIGLGRRTRPRPERSQERTAMRQSHVNMSTPAAVSH